MTNLDNIPPHWISAEIGELNAYKSSNINPSKFPDEVFELYSVPSFPSGKSDILSGSEIGSSKQEVEPGDVLLCKINPRINRVWVVGGKGTYRQIASSEWIVVRQEKIHPDFLKHYFREQSFRNVLCADVSGVGGSLTRAQPKRVAKYSALVAPLAEQKQIAAKLDELLAQVDTIKTRLDAIPAILKRFRQSVLAAAVCGRLTEEWRKVSGYVESPMGDDWKWVPIPASWDAELYPELVESRLGKMLDKAKNTGVLTRYLGNISVRWFGFDLTNLQEIRVSELEQMELSLRPGDVLICEGGEPGRSAVWLTSNDDPIIFQKALHRARVGKRILPDWLVYNLKNDADSRTLEQLFTGTTIKHLTGKSLKKYPMRVPPIDEQVEIIRRIEHFYSFADQIEQRVKEAQSRVNHLTQSILAKAFRGELTAEWREQNPDLISGENSAQALLERIKVEQAKLKPKKKVRKKRSA